MTSLSADAVLDTIVGLDAYELDRWIACGWVIPIGSVTQPQFDAVDVARVRLIWDLHYNLRIDNESVPIVLSLVDQLYATRRALREVLLAVAQASSAVRADIGSRIKP